MATKEAMKKAREALEVSKSEDVARDVARRQAIKALEEAIAALDAAASAEAQPVSGAVEMTDDLILKLVKQHFYPRYNDDSTFLKYSRDLLKRAQAGQSETAVRDAALKAAAKVSDDESEIRENAGLSHPEDSAERDRCFAAARAAHNCAVGIRALMQSTPAQQSDLNANEQYRMQMAGISTAALGYWKEGDSIHPDYDTPTLRDVARLYAKYAALHSAQQSAPNGDKRDAERYQYLKRFSSFSENTLSFHFAPVKHRWHFRARAEVDLAIDAAIAAEKKGAGE